MRKVLQVISWTGLTMTLLAPALFLIDRWDLPTAQTTMWVATLAWFAATPFWMGRAPDGSAAGEERENGNAPPAAIHRG